MEPKSVQAVLHLQKDSDRLPPTRSETWQADAGLLPSPEPQLFLINKQALSEPTARGSLLSRFPGVGVLTESLDTHTHTQTLVIHLSSVCVCVCATAVSTGGWVWC